MKFFPAAIVVLTGLSFGGMASAQGLFPNTPDEHVQPGHLTGAQALAAMNNSCSNVSTLSEDGAGNWHGFCSKGAMMVKPTGEVVASTGPQGGLTEGNARAMAMGAGCNNVSNLTKDAQGNWTGACSSGLVQIDPQGKVTTH